MFLNHGYEPTRNNWSKYIQETLLLPELKNIFGSDSEINNVVGTDMDVFYGTDFILKTSTRTYPFGFRARGKKYLKYHEVTIRNESLQTFGKLLEIKTTMARYLFYCWVNAELNQTPTEILNWYIVDLQTLIELYINKKLYPVGNILNRDASSTFLPFYVTDLMDTGCVFASKYPLQ
jgi:hypothetical protein